METYLNTTGMVYHMEKDLSREGFIMFSDGASLETTNGKTTYKIVGVADQTGYMEGVGRAARFGWITGFAQLNETHVMIVDSQNHCLRIVDRRINTSGKFVGECGTSGYLNGLSAYFDSPSSVIVDQVNSKDLKNPDILLVTDTRNNAVRFVDVKLRSVSTYLNKKNALNYPIGLTFDPRTSNLFTTNSNDIMAHNVEDDSDIRITGNHSKGWKDGKLQDASFGVPTAVLSLRDHLLLVADQDNGVLRILDLLRKNVSSICRNGTDGAQEGNATSCQLNTPRSLLLLSDGYLYIGQYRRITRIKGMV